MNQAALKDAATIILLRDLQTDPRILMGQRGKAASFMPNKMVFPGGAVDPGDADIPLDVAPLCAERLMIRSNLTAATLAAAAIRELMEETGLMLGTPGHWDAPADWAPFAQAGLRPSAQGMSYVFRATTPPGRPRRFDARFFLADADLLHGDPDDFSAASGELSYLQWVPVSQAKSLDLPFITEVVLSEVAALTQLGPPPSVPFFENTDEESLFHRLGGRSALDG